MKKVMCLVGLLILALSFGVVNCPAATNTLYTATVSTFAVTDTGDLADINLSEVKIKSITLTQSSVGTAAAQDIRIYKNFNSTTTAELVYTYAIPATVGTYTVYPFTDISTSFTGADSINIPYFAIRTSSSTSASNVKVNVNYWK